MGPVLAPLFAVFLAAPGSGTPPSAAVQWDAPAACPDDAAVEGRIAALVGDAVVVTPATARVEQHGDRFEVELVTWIDGGSQRRVLAASSCDALADAVAVVIAVALDPVVSAQAPAIVAVSEVAAIERTPPPLRTRAREEAPTQLVQRSPLQLGLVIAGGYGSGIAPHGNALTHLGLAIGRRAWAIELDARLWLPRTFGRNDPNGGARVLLGTFGALACGKGVFGRVELPVCAGLEVGGLRARGLNLDQPATRSYQWLAPRARVGLRVALGRGVGLVLVGEGAVPLFKAQLQVRRSGQTETRWETQRASLRVMLGLDFRWTRDGTGWTRG
jgi:hypothetical protein